jgi:flagellar hook-associated protein 3 FlgL
MRVGSFGVYNQFVTNQNSALEDLLKVNNQISSGKKIQYGHEDANVYVDSLRLDSEKATLLQVTDTTQKATTFSNNTDVAINQLKGSLEQFKIKLLQASNGVHSTTSMQAIAGDLEALKLHMLDTANSSINGTYLFSGTNLKQRPFDDEANYFGNDQTLKAQAGDKLQIGYNIDGASMFFGADTDYNKVITTNVKHWNMVQQHHKALSTEDPEGTDTEVVINGSNSIKELVGQPDDDQPTTFYIRGRKANGDAFKEKFDMTNNAKVSDLLDKVGRAFGNTKLYNAVEVTMSEHGQIEITDIRDGRMLTDFHMVAADVNVDDLDELAEMTDAHIIEFQKSGFSYPRTHATIESTQNFYDQRIFEFNAEFRDEYSDELALYGDLAQKIFSKDVDQVTINVNGTDYVHTVTALTDMEDILNTIRQDLEAETGSGFDVSMRNGKIAVFDKSATDPYAEVQVPTKLQRFSLTTQNSSSGENVVSFSDLDALGYDQARFEKEGAVLKSNVSQVIQKNNAYATKGTSLNEVTGSGGLDEKVFMLDVIDVKGVKKKVEFTIRDVPDANGNLSTFKVVEPASMATAEYNIYDEFGNKTAGKNYTVIKEEIDKFTKISKEVEVNGVTYSQLLSVVQVVMADTLPASNDFDGYVQSIDDSLKSVNVDLDHLGKINIKDLTTSATKMQFSMYDVDSNRFDDYTKDMTKGWQQTFQGIKGEQGWDVLESNPTSTLDRVFGFDFPGGLTLSGTDLSGNAASVTVNATDTLQALQDQIDTTFGDGAGASQFLVFVEDGKMMFRDNTINNPTQVNINFAFNNAQIEMDMTEGAPLTFAANNALIIDQPKIDFFSQVDEAIGAVKSSSYRADGDSGTPRNIGIENAILMIEHLFDHVIRKQTENGSHGQALQLSYEKSEITLLNVAQLKSTVLDTDIGAAVVELNRRSVSYQAMLSTIGRINTLSLVSYLR